LIVQSAGKQHDLMTKVTTTGRLLKKLNADL